MILTEGWAIFIIGQIVILFAVTLKFGMAYGRLVQANQANHEDINRIGKKLRSLNKLSWQRLDSIEEFLIEKARYSPPSLNIFEEEDG
jgi:hypothetical protein